MSGGISHHVPLSEMEGKVLHFGWVSRAVYSLAPPSNYFGFGRTCKLERSIHSTAGDFFFFASRPLEIVGFLLLLLYALLLPST